MISRRNFCISTATSVLFAAARSSADADDQQDTITRTLVQIETASGGRLGVCILDAAARKQYGYRMDERFMMLSSFKLLASALVLSRVDHGEETLDRQIQIQASDLVAWSPVTEKHLDTGMTMAQLCEATVTTSDNTAANLILKSFGGPDAVTRFARSLDDAVTRLDRYEPELNQPTAENLLDTTSPAAMAGTLHKLLLADGISPSSRRLLNNWLRNNTTGEKRLKAGLPASWKIGDKTGTSNTAANDIGIIWPEHYTPLLVTAYLADTTAGNIVKEATLAAVGELVYQLYSSKTNPLAASVIR
jgi:beta-lactamase class A